ncbi:hypothetical protein L6164_034077 [Bauhinia variegata]|uniref:Uncharacterized protein n=1 Tax=Bauhinia variegata TaxID=167791 RepID=A0ACB9KTU5_BAUVA|nr:hypothetical protein L6164_034077 [Bauhinia variegata]
MYKPSIAIHNAIRFLQWDAVVCKLEVEQILTIVLSYIEPLLVYKPFKVQQIGTNHGTNRDETHSVHDPGQVETGHRT